MVRMTSIRPIAAVALLWCIALMARPAVGQHIDAEFAGQVPAAGTVTASPYRLRCEITVPDGWPRDGL